MASKKPTQEELDKKLQEAEDLQDPDNPKLDEDEEDQEDDENADATEDQDENDEDNQDEEDEEQPKQPVKKEQTTEERYRQSTQEAQILHNKTKKFSDTVDQAANLPAPTEAELKAEYPEWEDMTPTEQRFAKDNLINKRKFDMIHGVVLEGKKIDEWSGKVDQFLVKAATTYPGLDGKDDEFKKFCMKETRRGVDFEVLANAFLNIVGQAKPPRKKGSLLATASGGRPDTKKNEYIDEKQAARLRTTDQKTYNRLVREKKIKIEL